MSIIDLPDFPRGTVAKVSFLRFGADLTSVLGGRTQRLRRLGMRYSVNYQLPPLGPSLAKALIAARLYSDTEGATIVAPFPQPPMTDPVGAPVIDGASQAGTVIDLKGLTPGIYLKTGAALSFNDGTRNFPHILVNNALADGDGKATVRLAPMLRVSPANLTHVEMVRPVIEGFIDEAPAWDLSYLRHYGLSFTLTEDR